MLSETWPTMCAWTSCTTPGFFRLLNFFLARSLERVFAPSPIPFLGLFSVGFFESFSVHPSCLPRLLAARSHLIAQTDQGRTRMLSYLASRIPLRTLRSAVPSARTARTETGTPSRSPKYKYKILDAVAQLLNDKYRQYVET